MDIARRVDDGTLQEEILLWGNEIKDFQNLLPLQAKARSLKDEEIPKLEAELQEHEEEYPDVREAAERVTLAIG